MTSNIDKAIELINTFATGDAEKAAGLLAEGYVQHNLAYGTGRDAFVGSVERLASAPVKTTVQNIRAYQDGDKVFLHTVYDFAGAGEQVAFDVFRFDEDGLICEHWDNLAPKAGPNPSGRTQVDGQVEARDLDATEANRELVRAFLADVMQGEHPDKTPEYFDGDSYLQHNTQIADGLSGLGAALAAMAEQGVRRRIFVLPRLRRRHAGQPPLHRQAHRPVRVSRPGDSLHALHGRYPRAHRRVEQHVDVRLLRRARRAWHRHCNGHLSVDGRRERRAAATWRGHFDVHDGVRFGNRHRVARRRHSCRHGRLYGHVFHGCSLPDCGERDLGGCHKR